jgi:hypothetical protein
MIAVGRDSQTRKRTARTARQLHEMPWYGLTARTTAAAATTVPM